MIVHQNPCWLFWDNFGILNSEAIWHERAKAVT